MRMCGVLGVVCAFLFLVLFFVFVGGGRNMNEWSSGQCGENYSFPLLFFWLTFSFCFFLLGGGVRMGVAVFLDGLGFFL